MNCNGNVLDSNYCESFREGLEDYLVAQQVWRRRTKNFMSLHCGAKQGLSARKS